MIQSSTKSLLALAMGGFGIGMTEFVIMGLLPNVAENLNITIPEAGYLISSYALGVVIGAPILTALGGKYSPKKLLILLMAMFTLFNGVSSLAPEFYSLMFFRFLSGLPHGAYFGVGAVVASRLAEKGKEASAVASMFAGLTLANVFGVPLATFVGARWGWQWAFGMVAVVGLLTTFSLKAWIPEMVSNPASSIREDLKIFKNPNIWLCILITSIGCGGFFAWMSYIAPLLIKVSLFPADSIPLWMVLAGVGMTVGIFWGGKLADRYAPVKVTLMLMSVIFILLLLNGLFADKQWVMVPLIFLTGMFSLALASPIQLLLIRYSRGAEMLGASLGQASFNIGNSLGAFLGGIPLVMGYSYSSPPLVGVGMCFMGIIFVLVLIKRS